MMMMMMMAMNETTLYVTHAYSVFYSAVCSQLYMSLVSKLTAC